MAEQAGVEDVNDIASQEELVVASEFSLIYYLNKLNAININIFFC